MSMQSSSYRNCSKPDAEDKKQATDDSVEHRSPGAPREHHPTEAHPAGLEQETKTVIEEARMVLPGIQALFGFQLMAVFNNGFNDLKPQEQVLHLSALLLVAVAIALIMTPASFHRIAEKGIVSRRFVELGSRLLALAMLPLMFGLSIELFIVARLVLNNVSMSAVIAAALLLLFSMLWFVFPWAERRTDRPMK
jgi:Family of unknown function (DUF6328)